MDFQSNPQTTHGTPLANYVEGSWDAYLQSMDQQGTYGDHITLQRASELFNVQVLVISTLGPNATSLIAPSNVYNENLPVLILGHIAGGHGEHYVSLSGPVSHIIDSVQEEESERLPSHSRAPCDRPRVGEETSQKGLSSPASPSEIINPHQVTIPNSSVAELSEPSEAERSDITLDALSNQGDVDHNDEADTGHFEHLGMSEETIPTLPEETP